MLALRRAAAASPLARVSAVTRRRMATVSDSPLDRKVSVVLYSSL